MEGGKISWKRFFFSLVWSRNFPCLGQAAARGKTPLEKAFFPGFEQDFSNFWEEKITWKSRFFPIFGLAWSWFFQDLGWIWEYLEPNPAGASWPHSQPLECARIAPKWDFPKNSHLGKGLSPLLPCSRDGGDFLGGGKSQILGSGAAESWELIPLIGSL